ncbi:Uncharacterized protein PRO82_000581 [Candidatus Protochlamydia amoebophila]|uniref:CPn0927/CPn0928 family alpha/beta hydrolase fold protein n=1 Tax=Candidatus Protochlamydia amoebophila TaxID=362787 RepID=UPI001BC8D7C9|nr:CPn0927/CPn0928 family alpha/beta hydrolase fold protein [Candidatus Protochlamydia amoebophila]MBS4163281.1 Uncharacterized protein [Candidatus Protochlamydia amoebophila]
MNEPVAFQTRLTGSQAFYDHSDYITSTTEDFNFSHTLSTTYRWNAEHKIIRIIKGIFSLIVFPFTIMHIIAGKIALLPASSPTLHEYPENFAHKARMAIDLQSSWKYKRLTIKVDDYKIDAMIMGQKETLDNGRWVLASNGNAEFYESKLNEGQFKKLLVQINSNAIFFNYPGVGASSNLPNKNAMTKAYQALLNFLEDQEKGIAAKEIIGFGHSIGAGVQAEALKRHALKSGIKYVWVKSRTFSDLATTAGLITNKVLGLLVKVIGWNIDCVESSKALQAPEIILQTASVANYQELTNSSKIIHDGIIPENATLAKVLLDQGCSISKKRIIGVPESHNQELTELQYLANSINQMLA